MNSSGVTRSSKPFKMWKLVWILIFLCLLVVAVGNLFSVRDRVRINQLNNRDANIRKHAASELGFSRNSRAVEPLIAALNDADPGVRGSAATALGQIKDLRALEPLLAALKADVNNGNHEPAKLEAKALGSLGPPALAPLMSALHDNGVRDYAEDGLVQMGAPAVEPLDAALNDNDGWVRTEAAYALGEIKDPRADDSLIAALKDPYWNVKQAAANALIKINDPKAVSFLLTALHDHNNEVIDLASTFFIRRGEPGSEDALIEALEKTSDTSLAEEFLNCGNQKLRHAAEVWASKRIYLEIHNMPGGKGAAWGSSR